MEIELKGQKKELKQLKYLDAVDVEETRQKEGLRAATKKFLVHSGLTDEDAESLTLEDGLIVQKALNELSINFQTPTEDKELKAN